MIHRELVPGKLRIVRRLGVGGMGVVYEAIHLGLDRRVAVKVIHPQSSESAEARTRFFREARAMALLQSEHIVQVLDVDTLPEGDPYMVMEYLEGRDLKRELAKRGPLPVAEAVGYLIQAATGVAVAHGAGIIHRDIKPANIFITNLDGARRAKILDFGVAKFASSPDQHVTGPTCLLGTPLYMSPEQIAGMEADSRCDVWALGVVLFQLLTGHSPFRAKGNEGMVGAVLGGSATPLHEARKEVPLALSQVVARCLEKVHADRFNDARELAAALSPFGPRDAIVRASLRAPRGSSAAPATALQDQDFEHLVIVPRSPALPSERESVTVTHPGVSERIPTVALIRASIAVRDSTPGSPPDSEDALTDPNATIRFRAPTLLPVQAASPKVDSSSNDADSSERARGKRLLPAIAGAAVLILAVAVCVRLLTVAKTPVGAAPLSSPTGVSSAAMAALGEPASATASEPPPTLTAPAPTLTAPASAPSAREVLPLAPRLPRPGLRDESTRARLPRHTAQSRSGQTLAEPSPPSGSAAVPLHL